MYLPSRSPRLPLLLNVIFLNFLDMSFTFYLFIIHQKHDWFSKGMVLNKYVNKSRMNLLWLKVDIEDICLSFLLSLCFHFTGNHELWVKDRNIMNNHMNSVEKFERILDLCETIGVLTDPGKEVLPDGDAVWIVPLFSW